ncbi:flippase-like domain-containing protein, partial [Candidatus Pacearchaeota archaeon]|nr:flippase-like domain-containing protein [Candidatus Pacearchaeota archaeon]MBD3282837.1 flippase-like domain-containing protein [Candidatus Pacearchaeota archaeon]
MKWKRYLSVIGIIIFIYILIKIDLREVWNELNNANPYYILIAVFIVIISLFTQTLKWFVIARKQKINIDFKESFIVNVITNFYGFVTPSRLGTILRSEYLRKKTGNIGKGLCNFTLDKILDISSVCVMAFFSFFIFKDVLPFIAILISGIIFIFLFIMTVIFIDKKRSKIILKTFFRKSMPQKLKDKAKITFDSFYDHIPKKRYFVIFFILNILNWIVLYT